MRRRRFLRSDSAVGALALAGCANDDTADEETTPLKQPLSETGTPPVDVPDDWAFSEIVDITDVGADDTGSDPIGDVLDEHATDGHFSTCCPGGVDSMTRSRSAGTPSSGSPGTTRPSSPGRVRQHAVRIRLSGADAGGAVRGRDL